MRAVTERLRFRQSAAAPIVIFCTENRVLHLIGTYSRLDWEGMFAFISLQASFEVLSFVLLYFDIRKRSEILVQELF